MLGVLDLGETGLDGVEEDLVEIVRNGHYPGRKYE